MMFKSERGLTDESANPPFFLWCRSRDLNPDERNSLPPQDSVSTISTTSAFCIGQAANRSGPYCRFPLTSGASFCQHENGLRRNSHAILPAAEPFAQVVRLQPVMQSAEQVVRSRSPERELPAAGVVPARLVSRPRPGLHLPSPISLYGLLSKTKSAR